MNIIFITLSNINSIKERGIYADLMRKFRDEGHNVYIVSAAERRMGMNTQLLGVDGIHILKVHTLNVQKTNVIEKGIGTLMMERQYKQAIKKHLGHIYFDLILYSTPPITFTNVVRYLKRVNPGAVSYLLLKDIFPQNAVDIGMLQGMPVQGSWFKVQGWAARVKYQLYRYFRKKEKRLYALSDYIGCMSPANVEYVLKHNPEIDASRVEVAPNSLKLQVELSELDERNKRVTERIYIRSKYQLPVDKPIYIYGGNLGRPQGIDFLIKCLDANNTRNDCFFLIVGDGTEYKKLASWLSMALDNQDKVNVKLMQRLPKEDYDMLVGSCDVGLIFLDHRFTIPNFPSRLLSYMENKMPVLCATDPTCDMGSIAEENGFGYWCESNSVEAFTAILDKMIHSDRKAMGENGYQYFLNNYTVDHTYKAIVKHL